MSSGQALGSSSLLSDSNGNPLPNTTAHYLPFGSYRGTPPDPTLTDRGFTGHKHNNDLGLIYMNARYYLPAIGRFLSADILVPDPSNPQSFNRYAYVENNPLNYFDPSGQCKGTVYENDYTGCIKWLEVEYGIDIGVWEADEMELLWALQESFDFFRNLLGSILFNDRFGSNFTFNYIASERVFFGGTTSNQSIFLTGLLYEIDPAHASMGVKDIYTNWVLVISHEMAHRVVNPSFLGDDPRTGVNGIGSIYEIWKHQSGWDHDGSVYEKPEVGPVPEIGQSYSSIYTTPYVSFAARNPLGVNLIAEDAAENLAVSLVIGQEVLHPHSTKILPIVYDQVDWWYWQQGLDPWR